MVLDASTCLKYYKRKEIQEAIIEHARNKEIGLRYGDSFGKRPEILSYLREVLELAQKGVTSFHCSEELWENPLELSSDSTRKEQEELRTGWDLVLDIDCKQMEYSRICADLIIKFLRYCEVKDISLKYSGNKGFHIGVPFEAFPAQVGNVSTKSLFPEAAKKIALYIRENIKEELGRRIMEFEQNDFLRVKEKVELSAEEIITQEKNSYGDIVPKLKVDKFLEIDTVLISSRHLYRMPYSLHEKSGLASLPLDPNQVLQFEKSMALPEKVVPQWKFLERQTSGESARRLLLQALDFRHKEDEIKKERTNSKSFTETETVIQSPITSEFYPPCVDLMLKGLEDGKKRAVFCLMNFLGKLGWNKAEIEAYLRQWNQEKNPQPLRENYLQGQLHSFLAGGKLPPNCNNEAYYKGIGVCRPDALCSRIKNPVNYTLIKWKKKMREKAEEEEAGSRKRMKKKEAETSPEVSSDSTA